MIRLKNRQSIRLPTHDYSQPGAYFVTVCTYGRHHLFGRIVKESMELNSLGTIVQNELLKSVSIRLNIEIDEYIIMPNHIHFIVWIVDPVGACCARPPYGGDHSMGDLGARNAPLRRTILGKFMAGFKSAVTKRVGYSVWQRNYHEHIIRDHDELNRIRQYIIDNPRNWKNDPNSITYTTAYAPLQTK